MRRVALFSLMLGGLVLAQNIGPEVTTHSGRIKGHYKYSNNGRRYRAFEGIPFAKPPTKELRFEPPVPIEPWKGVLVADTLGPICLQYNVLAVDPKNPVEGSEDCLYLNVYAAEQRKRSKDLLPVVFYIFGGAFYFSSSRLNGPELMLDRDVILVTSESRLGPLGFMSTEDDIIPGNMGLKDQSLALRWVSENIGAFGGDPERITIAGASTGAACVHYHYLSPWSKGLFRGGISLSGTALHNWALTEIPLQRAKRVAAMNGCPTKCIREMVRCLKSRPGTAIARTVGRFRIFQSNPLIPFGPVVEKGGEAPFINRRPIDIILSGEAQDLPWITGVVSREGLWPAIEFMGNNTLLKQLDEDWDTLGPVILDYEYTIPKSLQPAVGQKIKSHYFGSRPIDRSTIGSLIRLIGDRKFIVDVVKAARFHAAIYESPVWVYYFSYRGAHSLTESLTGNKTNFGVCHLDDNGYTLSSALNNVTTTPEDREMSREMIDFWMTFATRGEPNVGTNWPKVNPCEGNLTYINIKGPGKFILDSNRNLGDYAFWNSIDFNENKL